MYYNIKKIHNTCHRNQTLTLAVERQRNKAFFPFFNSIAASMAFLLGISPFLRCYKLSHLLGGLSALPASILQFCIFYAVQLYNLVFQNVL